MITIVDYGLGNLGSIKNMLKRLGYDSVISDKVSDIEKANKLILPGVGSFDAGMQKIHEKKYFDILNKKVLVEKVPILGICLGMQMLTYGSEEGNLAGFGWINGYAKKFNLSKEYKVPHMGWNEAAITHENALTSDFLPSMRFYFVHSYAVSTDKNEDTFLDTIYGHNFSSGIHKDNIYGVQFHPEKSHKYGMIILKNFACL